MAICEECQGKLPFTSRMRGSSVCPECKARARAAADEARRQAEEEHEQVLLAYESSLDVLSLPPAELVAALPRLRAREVPPEITPAERQVIEQIAFEDLAAQLASDGYLSLWEQVLCDGVASALGVKLPAESAAARLFVLGRLSAGRLDSAPWPDGVSFRTYPDEDLYWYSPGRLVERVDVKELRLKADNIVLNGERLSTEHSEIRGKEVVTGGRLEPRATGTIYVTSHRFLFVGDHASFDVPYERVIQVLPRTDGVIVQVSDGTSHMLITPQAEFVAAYARAASARAAGHKAWRADREQVPPMPPADADVEGLLAEAVRRQAQIDSDWIRLLSHVGDLNLQAVRAQINARPSSDALS